MASPAGVRTSNWTPTKLTASAAESSSFSARARTLPDVPVLAAGGNGRSRWRRRASRIYQIVKELPGFGFATRFLTDTARPAAAAGKQFAAARESVEQSAPRGRRQYQIQSRDHWSRQSTPPLRLHSSRSQRPSEPRCWLGMSQHAGPRWGASSRSSASVRRALLPVGKVVRTFAATRSPRGTASIGSGVEVYRSGLPRACFPVVSTAGAHDLRVRTPAREWTSILPYK